jgi:hypothetical protein
MPSIPFPKPTSVPLVGQPLKAHEGFAMATFTCLCRPDNAPQLLRGTDVYGVCLLCRKIYAIVRVEFDRNHGHKTPMVTVGVVGQAEQESTN